ncbi:MAG: RNA polymerase sigma factor [Terriglobales bacterium]
MANSPADPAIGASRPAALAEDVDGPLVLRIQAGDGAAFESLYARYQGPISRLVANMVRYPEVVPDLVQEIFAKAYFALGSFTPGMPFRPWLYRLASNHTIDFLRRQRRQPRTAEPPALDSAETREWELPDTSGPNALERLVSRDLAAKLLSGMKPRDRQLLVMQDLQDLSLEEICAVTGLGLSAVKVGLFRARKRMLASYQKLTKRKLP